MNANQQEQEFKWLEAAKTYEQEIELKDEQDLTVPELWERVGACYGMASRQAQDLE
ncbi:TPA: hypothetical protein HA274_00445, partial [Candidatus Bathyarchaeota archaeon]|nr:hypothetical protein [Candidatus Bathyarchaeota archaeon]